MNPFVFEFAIRQHTPIIHFLHEDLGASIRASEIKPKLDNFIFQKLLASRAFPFTTPPSFAFKEYTSSMPSEWNNYLVGSGLSEHAALDYKLSVKINNSKVKHYDIGKIKGGNSWELQYPAFFANMGKDPENPKDFRFFSFCEEDIVCKITCTNPGLKNYFLETEKDSTIENLQNTLTEFFLIQNFGMRQSKGFGSFTLSRYKGNPIQVQLDEFEFQFQVGMMGMARNASEASLLMTKRYSNKKDIENYENWLNLYDHIDYFYRSLRSGINIPSARDPFYFKSMMFHWAKNQAKQWDKKTIRYNLFGGGNGQDKHFKYIEIEGKKYPSDGSFNWLPANQNPGMGKFNFRDLLGLSSEQAWRIYDNSIVKKEVEDSNQNKLARFKSPILFKPVIVNGEWTVIIQIFPIPKPYFGASFNVTATKRNGSVELVTPDEFSVRDYLKFAIDFFNNADPIDLVGKANQVGHKSMRMLTNIYNDLNPIKNA